MINIPLRLTEIGKIKVGGAGPKTQTKNGKTFSRPVKFNEFKVTTLERGNDGAFVEDKDIMAKISNKKELDIILLSDNIDDNFYTSFAFYNGKKRACYSDDGIVAHRTLSNGNTEDIKCDFQNCPYFKDKKCKVNGRLNAILPQSEISGGVYVFRTTGWHSVSNILSCLSLIQMSTKGVLSGLPLKLRFNKKSTKEFGNVIAVDVVYKGTIAELMESSQTERKFRIESGYKPIEIGKLGNVIEYAEETEEEIADEFYPESEIDTAPTADLNDLTKQIEEPKKVEEPKKTPKLKKEPKAKKEAPAKEVIVEEAEIIREPIKQPEPVEQPVEPTEELIEDIPDDEDFDIVGMFND